MPPWRRSTCTSKMKHEKLLKKLGIDEDLRPFVDHYVEWFMENVKEVITAEQTLVHQMGYAGTADLYAVTKDGKRALIDFKTQGVKSNGPNFYDSWAYQLAAYVNCLPHPRSTKCISLVINSNTPEPVVDKVWTKDEISNANKIFRAALTSWQLKKKYRPIKEALHGEEHVQAEAAKQPIPDSNNAKALNEAGKADEPAGEAEGGVENSD